jgi:hypothetical protein
MSITLIKLPQLSIMDHLKNLIQKLQDQVRNHELTTSNIDTAIEALKNLGYTYDENKFPSLPHDTHAFDAKIDEVPNSLAEALLWKLGKWPAYKKFVSNFEKKEEVSSEGGVVFSAFAKHLQNQANNPIYDQHAMRAIWAITVLSPKDQDQCKRLLLNKGKMWKDAGSGNSEEACYNIFVEQINHLCQVNEISHSHLDKLLMPLGQAIKKTKIQKTDEDTFMYLCGWSA